MSVIADGEPTALTVGICIQLEAAEAYQDPNCHACSSVALLSACSQTTDLRDDAQSSRMACLL